MAAGLTVTATLALNSVLVLSCTKGKRMCLFWLGTSGSGADCVTATAPLNSGLVFVLRRGGTQEAEQGGRIVSTATRHWAHSTQALTQHSSIATAFWHTHPLPSQLHSQRLTPGSKSPHLHHRLGYHHGVCILGHAAALSSEDGLQFKSEQACKKK